MAEFPLKQGDTSPALAAQIVDADSVAIDITGSTVTFSMWHKKTKTMAVTAQAATIVTAADGQVRYDWQSSDTDLDPGLYDAEFTVTYSDTTIETAPNDSYIVVRIYEKVD